MQRIRISKDAFAAGFRIKHIGEVLYASVKNEFDAVVDKCEVVIYTDPAECTRIRHEVAIPTFNKRDDRLLKMHILFSFKTSCLFNVSNIII